MNKIARFYDNSEDNIINFQKNLPIVKSILVNDSIPNERLQNIVNDPKIYPSSFENNKFAIYNLSEGGEIITPSRGLTIYMIYDIIITYQQKALHKYLFLDWDRTISVTEGFICPYKPELFRDHGIDNYEDILEYIVGGKERVNLLRNMYITITNNNTKVFIITNNGSSSKNNKGNRPEFLKIIQLMFPNFPEENLISSYDFHGDKVISLKETFLSDYLLLK